MLPLVAAAGPAWAEDTGAVTATAVGDAPAGSALAALATIPVKGRAPMTGEGL